MANAPIANSASPFTPHPASPTRPTPTSEPSSRSPVPGEITAPPYRLHLRIQSPSPTHASATLRPWKPGDRVHLRHSSGPKKVKEVLERMKVVGAARAKWPVVELGGRIVWMQGVSVEPGHGIEITVTQL